MLSVILSFVLVVIVYFIYNQRQKNKKYFDCFCGLSDIPLIGSEMAFASRTGKLSKNLCEKCKCVMCYISFAREFHIERL